MAFLRVKRIRGRDYAYLVESRWDAKKHTSRQATLKYVGPVARSVWRASLPDTAMIGRHGLFSPCNVD